MKPTTASAPEYVARPAHPAANAFPMLPAAELEEFAADIRKNGLLYPIELVRGQIVDGRNRLAACELAGVAPQFRDLTDTLPNDEAVVRHVIAANIHRRHLSVAQRAAIAAELATLELGANQHRKPAGSRNRPEPSRAKEPPPNGGPSTAQAARLLGVSTRSVERAKATKKANPAAHEAAKRGEPKPRIPKPAPTTRATSTEPPAPPQAPAKPGEASGSPTSTRRETAPGWYVQFVDRVLELARATIREHKVDVAELLEAIDDAYRQLEDEAEGWRA